MPHLGVKRSKQPLVSIITIVKDGEAGLRKTIESVLSQDYGHFEYLVIDGGSTDGTVKILHEYDAQLTFWRSEPDRGISDAFNKGIKNAAGEIIGLLNAGDWYEKGTLKKVVDAFGADQQAGVVCGKLQFWKNTDKEYLCNSEPDLLEREMSVTHPTCFVRAELYEKYGFFSEEYKYAMDYELLLRLRRKGVVFLVLDTVLANMQHEGVSEENWLEALRETHRARTVWLGNSLFSSLWYYYFLSTKRWLRIQCEKYGMEKLLHFYRSRLALVRKTK